MRAVVVGAVESTAIAIREITATKGWSLPLVVTLPDSLRGRHSDFVDLAPLAQEAGARLVAVANTNDDDTVDLIRSIHPDFIFVIGWSQICGASFRDVCPNKIIGYHPAPIPRLRGRAVIPWTILLAEPITAGTLFWMDEGIDSGSILAQRYFHVSPDATARSLYGRHMLELRRMLAAVLEDLSNGVETRMPQDETCATYATKRTPGDGLIDWRNDRAEIERLVRAVGKPYPGAFTYHGGRKLKVWRSRLVAGGETFHAIPGQVVDVQNGILKVMTPSGLISIEDWELEGGGIPKMHSVLGV